MFILIRTVINITSSELILFRAIVLHLKYSRTLQMWTANGQTKSVHNSEVSTLVKLGVATGYRGKPNRLGEKCPQCWGVHSSSEVSTGLGSTVL